MMFCKNCLGWGVINAIGHRLCVFLHEEGNRKWGSLAPLSPGAARVRPYCAREMNDTSWPCPTVFFFSSYFTEDVIQSQWGYCNASFSLSLCVAQPRYPEWAAGGRSEGVCLSHSIPFLSFARVCV